MRLLNVHTGRIETFYGDALKNTPYAILSHTWLQDRNGSPQEALYQDFAEQEHPLPRKAVDVEDPIFNVDHDRIEEMDIEDPNFNWDHARIEGMGVEDPIFKDDHPRIKGFKKVQRCRQRAIKDNIGYVWIDTCCIDKTSSAELSEAIISMFSWYSNAYKCYILLDGVRKSKGHKMKDIGKSPWFQRGWTLQELIASKTRVFLDEDWEQIGIMDLQSNADRSVREIAEILHTITKIQVNVLMQECDLTLCGVPQRMEWAAHRMTTRPEDMAYCLMGIFKVNIPVVYGEGFEEAFRRFQEGYIARYPDHSIFAWMGHEGSPRSSSIGSLAKHPKDFVNLKSYGGFFRPGRPVYPFHVTHLGISMKVPLRVHCGNRYAILNLLQDSDEDRGDGCYGIQLEETEFSGQDTPIYKRVRNGEIRQFQSQYPEKYFQIFI